MQINIELFCVNIKTEIQICQINLFYNIVLSICRTNSRILLLEAFLKIYQPLKLVKERILLCKCRAWLELV